mgnify:CR=1 FL=1
MNLPCGETGWCKLDDVRHGCPRTGWPGMIRDRTCRVFEFYQQLVVKSSTRSPLLIRAPDGAQLVVNNPVCCPVVIAVAAGAQLVVNSPVWSPASMSDDAEIEPEVKSSAPSPQCRVSAFGVGKSAFWANANAVMIYPFSRVWRAKTRLNCSPLLIAPLGCLSKQIFPLTGHRAALSTAIPSSRPTQSVTNVRIPTGQKFLTHRGEFRPFHSAASPVFCPGSCVSLQSGPGPVPPPCPEMGFAR